MSFYIDHDGERFDYDSLTAALEYFHGCIADESIGTDIRFIDRDGKLVGIFSWDGVVLAKIETRPLCECGVHTSAGQCVVGNPRGCSNNI